jgi:hypothetical protein
MSLTADREVLHVQVRESRGLESVLGTISQHRRLDRRTEVASIAPVLRQENMLTAEEFTGCYQLCDRIAGMLSGLIARRHSM